MGSSGPEKYAGHTVTACVRNPAKLITTHPNLIVVEGGLDDPGAIQWTPS